MSFHKDVEDVVTSAGMTIVDADSFDGAIKKVRASRTDHYFSFKKDGKNILVKSIEQKVSGSAADKIAMFYLNLQDGPYDPVIVVADTRTQVAFTPLIDFFRARSMTLNKVHILTLDEFDLFINRKIHL